MRKIPLRKYKNITFIVPLYSFLLLISVYIVRYLFFANMHMGFWNKIVPFLNKKMISRCVITKSNLAVIKRLSALKINRLTTRKSLSSKTHRVSDVIIPMYIAVTLDRRQHVVGWLSASPKEKDNYIVLRLSPH